jgi:hypothetical protein
MVCEVDIGFGERTQAATLAVATGLQEEFGDGLSTGPLGGLCPAGGNGEGGCSSAWAEPVHFEATAASAHCVRYQCHITSHCRSLQSGIWEARQEHGVVVRVRVYFM